MRKAPQILKAEKSRTKKNRQQVEQEKARLESEALFRALFEKNQAVTLLLDVEDKNLSIVDANEAAVKYYGYSKDDLLQKTIMDLNTLPAEEVRKKMAAAREQNKTVFELQHQLASGEIRDIESYSGPIDIFGHKLVYVVVHDITYRKRSEMIQDLLYNISNAVHTSKDLNELFKLIRDELSQIFDTTNFYIAIYDSVAEIVSLPFFTEEEENFKSFPEGKTLAAYVIEKNQPTMITKGKIDRLVEKGEVETYGSLSKVWLGVPLKAKNEIVGIIAVQSYTSQTAYGEEELEILKFASDQIGLSIERKLAEIEIKASLDEKIVLLKEIHHRVKNNLQVISSLLYLQSKNLTDDESISIFLESQNRVRSMSLVHEKLYQSENLAKINLRLYIGDLVRFLFRTYKTNPNNIELNLDIEDVALDVDSAIPCGLIINELVSNCLKYAFPNQERGEIAVKFRSKNEHQYNLLVCDNGIGLKSYLETPDKKTLGLQLVDTLVDQLHGKVEINGKIGSEFNISFFKDKRKGKREFIK